MSALLNKEQLNKLITKHKKTLAMEHAICLDIARILKKTEYFFKNEAECSLDLRQGIKDTQKILIKPGLTPYKEKEKVNQLKDELVKYAEQILDNKGEGKEYHEDFEKDKNMAVIEETALVFANCLHEKVDDVNCDGIVGWLQVSTRQVI